MKRGRTMLLAVALALTALIITPAFGDTARIGNDVTDRDQLDTSWTDWWIVDTNQPAETSGTIDQIDYWAKTTNALKFLLVDGEKTVQWKSDTVTPEQTGLQSYTFDATFVGEGWHLGVYYPDTGVIAFSSDGDTYLEGSDQAGQPDVGDVLPDTDSRDRTYSMGADITPLAVSIVTVTEDNLGVDWSTEATSDGGSVAFVEHDTSPYGGAVQLSTDDTDQAKANLATGTGEVPLDEVTALGYHTFQPDEHTGPALAAVSYQLFVTFDDGTWTWLVYEPYWQNGTGDAAPVVAGVWQQWDLLDDGRFWSSQTAAGGGLDAGQGGPPLYTVDDVAALGQGATVHAIALNVGTYNPDWTVLADGMTFGTTDGITVFDFEPAAHAGDPGAACKDGGWEDMTDDDDREFRNQGDCVSYFASDGKTRGGGR